MRNLSAITSSTRDKPHAGNVSEYREYDEDELVISIAQTNHRTNRYEERIVFLKVGNGGLLEQLCNTLFNNCKILGDTLRPSSKLRGAKGLYLGAWKRYLQAAKWTVDSHQQDDKKAIVDAFLGGCAHVFQYMCGIIKRRFPAVYNRYTVAAIHLAEYDNRPFAPYAT